jgi:hypothetical protein
MAALCGQLARGHLQVCTIDCVHIERSVGRVKFKHGARTFVEHLLNVWVQGQIWSHKYFLKIVLDSVGTLVPARSRQRSCRRFKLDMLVHFKAWQHCCWPATEAGFRASHQLEPVCQNGPQSFYYHEAILETSNPPRFVNQRVSLHGGC